MTYRTTLTRKSKGGIARINDALDRGRYVMARAGEWFEIAEIREETDAEGCVMWYAVGKRPSGSGRCGEYSVRTVTWTEDDPAMLFKRF